MAYKSDYLKKLEGQKVDVTKFGTEPGSFDISKLLVNPIPYKGPESLFWAE